MNPPAIMLRGKAKKVIPYETKDGMGLPTHRFWLVASTTAGAADCGEGSSLVFSAPWVCFSEAVVSAVKVGALVAMVCQSVYICPEVLLLLLILHMCLQILVAWRKKKKKRSE